jgi:hypothetical protein
MRVFADEVVDGKRRTNITLFTFACKLIRIVVVVVVVVVVLKAVKRRRKSWSTMHLIWTRSSRLLAGVQCG